MFSVGIFVRNATEISHDDVIKWKHFPRYWPFVRGIHRSPVNSSHKGQWRGALMFSLICVWINGWVNNREAGDLRRYHVHYDVTVMCQIENRLKWLANAFWYESSITSLNRISRELFWISSFLPVEFIIHLLSVCVQHISRLSRQLHASCW